jgi:hypothetical protein
MVCYEMRGGNKPISESLGGNLEGFIAIGMPSVWFANPVTSEF